MEHFRKLYFFDPRLQMNSFERALVKSAIVVLFLILSVGTIMFLLSPAKWLNWAGVFILLFLLDYTFHYGKAERALSELPADGSINTALYFDSEANSSIISAFSKTIMFGGNFFLRLADDLSEKQEIQEALARLDVPANEFRAKIGDYLKKSLVGKNDSKGLTDKINKLASIAAEESLKIQSRDINPASLFAALRGVDDSAVTKLFELFEIKSDDLGKVIIFGRYRKMRKWTRPLNLSDFASQPYNLRHRFMNRAWTARPTPLLDKLSVDFTDMARAGKAGFLIGHENEYNELVNVLSRPDKPNALLVGETGRGSIVGHLAFMITQDKTPKPLFDKRVVMLDLNGLLAGADQAEVQARIKIIFDEIYKAGNIILYIPDIHNLSRSAVDPKQISIANTLIPLIVSNDFPTIGTTYPKECKQYIETDSSFMNAFQIIDVPEITVAETEIVLTYESLLLEKKYKTKIAYSAIKVAAELAYKYFRQKPLPISADDLLKDALAEASRAGDDVLNADDVIALASSRSNIPIKKADFNEQNKLLHLEELIHARLIDQEQAVKAVSRALREYRSGLSSGDEPIGSFLFVGPTGVGKTELAKILTGILFDVPSAMVRFDMSEYQDKQSISRFIGSPDGTISGALTDAVMAKPYSLILLDEFEKAHPDILNIFLQVFDDGRLTNNVGKMVNFQNVIIIATSNAQSDFIKSELDKGRTMDEISVELKKKLTSCFKPELLNRFSEIIVFKSLSREDMAAIARLLLNDLAAVLKEAKGVDLNFSKEAVEKIAELGYDRTFGARPLRKVISDKLKAPLSEMILSSKISRGMAINVGVENGEVKITV